MIKDSINKFQSSTINATVKQYRNKIIINTRVANTLHLSGTSICLGFTNID